MIIIYLIYKFRKNETIIKQGENGDCLYYIEEGNIECYKKFVSKY
jgi:CRP-like cAMP-binding protein